MKNSISKNIAIKKVIASTLVFTFTFSFILHDAWALIEEETQSVSYQSGIQSGLHNIVLPQNLGKIEEKWEAKTSKKLILHIKDVHCDYEAQHTISKIIDYFNKEYGIRTVNLEGGKGNYDISPFTDIKDPNERELVTDHFVRKGLVNGAEYFAINNPGKINLWGVEKDELYWKTLEIYRNTANKKEKINKYIGSITTALANLKKKIYSEDLAEFDKKYYAYKNKDIKLEDYLGYLTGLAGKNGIVLTEFQNICSIHKTLKIEEEIDFKKANSERDALIDHLRKILSDRETEELVLKILAFQKEEIPAKEFYSYLMQKADAVNADLKSLPNLEKYTNYVTAYETSDRAKLPEEMNRLENKLIEALCKTTEEKELMLLSRHLTMMENFFTISITSRDYEYYRSNEKAFDVVNYVKFIEKETGESIFPEDITLLDYYRKEMERFYEYTFKRDAAFMSNLRFDAGHRSQITDHRSPLGFARGKRITIHDSQTAILITGGFHSENLYNLFRANHISYISIMPKFDDKDGYESPYFALLNGGIDRAMGFLSLNAANIAIQSMLSEMRPVSGGQITTRTLIQRFKASRSAPKKGLKNRKGKSNQSKNVRVIWLIIPALLVILSIGITAFWMFTKHHTVKRETPPAPIEMTIKKPGVENGPSLQDIFDSPGDEPKPDGIKPLDEGYEPEDIEAVEEDEEDITVINTTDEKGNEVIDEIDEYGRLVRRTYIDGIIISRDYFDDGKYIEYHDDKDGKFLSGALVDQFDNLIEAWDKFGRVTRKIDPITGDDIESQYLPIEAGEEDEPVDLENPRLFRKIIKDSLGNIKRRITYKNEGSEIDYIEEYEYLSNGTKKVVKKGPDENVIITILLDAEDNILKMRDSYNRIIQEGDFRKGEETRYEYYGNSNKKKSVHKVTRNSNTDDSEFETTIYDEYGNELSRETKADHEHKKIIHNSDGTKTVFNFFYGTKHVESITHISPTEEVLSDDHYTWEEGVLEDGSRRDPSYYEENKAIEKPINQSNGSMGGLDSRIDVDPVYLYPKDGELAGNFILYRNAIYDPFGNRISEETGKIRPGDYTDEEFIAQDNNGWTNSAFGRLANLDPDPDGEKIEVTADLDSLPAGIIPFIAGSPPSIYKEDLDFLRAETTITVTYGEDGTISYIYMPEERLMDGTQSLPTYAQYKQNKEAMHSLSEHATAVAAGPDYTDKKISYMPGEILINGTQSLPAAQYGQNEEAMDSLSEPETAVAKGSDFVDSRKGGSWSSDPRYKKWGAWCLEPAVSYGLAWLIRDNIFSFGLISGGIFWGFHMFRAIREQINGTTHFFSRDNIMLDRDVLGLTLATMIIGTLSDYFGINNILSLILLSILTLYHISVNNRPLYTTLKESLNNMWRTLVIWGGFVFIAGLTAIFMLIGFNININKYFPQEEKQTPPIEMGTNEPETNDINALNPINSDSQKEPVRGIISDTADGYKRAVMDEENLLKQICTVRELLGPDSYIESYYDKNGKYVSEIWPNKSPGPDGNTISFICNPLKGKMGSADVNTFPLFKLERDASRKIIARTKYNPDGLIDFTETQSVSYYVKRDLDGDLVETEIRDGDGKLLEWRDRYDRTVENNRRPGVSIKYEYFPNSDNRQPKVIIFKTGTYTRRREFDENDNQLSDEYTVHNHPFRFPYYIWREIETMLIDKVGEETFDAIKAHGLMWTDKDGMRYSFEKAYSTRDVELIWGALKDAVNKANHKRKGDRGYVEDKQDILRVVEYHENIHALFRALSRDQRDKDLISHFKQKLEETFGEKLHENHPFITSFRKTYGKPYFEAYPQITFLEPSPVDWYLEEFLTLSIQETNLFYNKTFVLDKMTERADAGEKSYLEEKRDIIQAEVNNFVTIFSKKTNLKPEVPSINFFEDEEIGKELRQMAEDLWIYGADDTEYFTEIEFDNTDPEYSDTLKMLIKAEEVDGLFEYTKGKHKLRIIKKDVDSNDVIKKFFGGKVAPWCCPTFFQEGDNRYVYELDIVPFKYLTIEQDRANTLIDNYAEELGDTMRTIIAKTFYQNTDRWFAHEHLHGGNILIKRDDKTGEIIDVKIIDWGLLYEYKIKENPDLEKFIKGERDDLVDAEISETRLEGFDLEGVNFNGVQADGLTAAWANLKNAKFRRAVLVCAELEYADLRGADLTDAFLSEVRLTGANLTGAVLTRTNLIDANFEDVEIFKKAILKDVETDLDHAALFVDAGFHVKFIPEENIALVTSPEDVQPLTGYASQTDNKHMRDLIEVTKEKINKGELDPEFPISARIVDKNGNVIATTVRESYKERTKYGVGALHTEIAAIREAEERGFSDWENATIYMTLEPCGNCAKALTEFYGFKKVIYGIEDTTLIPVEKYREAYGKSNVQLVQCNDADIIKELEEINNKLLNNRKRGRPYFYVSCREDMWEIERKFREKYRSVFNGDIQVIAFNADLLKICEIDLSKDDNERQEMKTVWKGHLFRYLEWSKQNLNPKKPYVLLITGESENSKNAREWIVNDGIFEDSNIIIYDPKSLDRGIDKEYLNPIFQEFDIIPSFTIDTRKERPQSKVPHPLNLEIPHLHPGLINEILRNGLMPEHVTLHLMLLHYARWKEMVNLCSPKIKEMIESGIIADSVKKFKNIRNFSLHLGPTSRKYKNAVAVGEFNSAEENLGRTDAHDEIVARIGEIKEQIRSAGYTKKILLENCDYSPGTKYFWEPIFIRQIVQETDSDLLIDLGHIVSTASGVKCDGVADYGTPLEYLKMIIDGTNIDRLKELHISVPVYDENYQGWVHGGVGKRREALFSDKVDEAAAKEIEILLKYVLNLRIQNGIKNSLIINFETDDKSAKAEVEKLAQVLKSFKDFPSSDQNENISINDDTSASYIEKSTYEKAHELVPSMLQVMRKAPTYVIEPILSLENISPVMSYLRETERTVNKKGHNIHPRNYLLGKKWKDNLKSELEKILPSFYDDVTTFENKDFHENKTRMVIRLLSKNGEDNLTDQGEIKNFIKKILIEQINNKNGNIQEVEADPISERIIMSKIRFVHAFAGDAEHLNTAIDLFTDVTLAECDRYNKDDGYKDTLPESLANKLLNLLNASILNCDDIISEAGGRDITKILETIFSGYILKIRPVIWDSIKEWRISQDNILVAA